MPICTKCGQENPDGFRFCGSCGTALDASPLVRQERKVISVLFCDLVGYTATAQAADPEDVSRMLAAYHGLVRVEIERFGGAVEKFIGDAAVGVWGVPVAHEDDAERAVRAALAILDAVEADVRVAVNTGEALVRLDECSRTRCRTVSSERRAEGERPKRHGQVIWRPLDGLTTHLRDG